jgi:hypothetical protein
MKTKSDLEMVAEAVIRSLASLLVATVTVFLAAFAVQYGWNLSLPDLFSLPRMAYGNAVGLIVLVCGVRLCPIPGVQRK